MIRGHCECGAICFHSDTDVVDFSHCHCSQCRRLHGAAFGSFAGIARDQLRYESGESNLTAYASSGNSDRYFCRTCGSNILVATKDEPDVVYLCMGCVDDYSPLPRGYHQFVDSKASWIDIADDLPQHSEWDAES